MKSIAGYEHSWIHIAIYNSFNKNSASAIFASLIAPSASNEVVSKMGERAANLFLQYYYKYVYIACLNTYIYIFEILH